jgi:2-phospho-L-lactate guanylyltransferase
MNVWAIIPVKPLRDSKSRLSHILSADERAALTGLILSRTLEILNDLPEVYRTLVISRDPAVLKIARQYEAQTFGEGEKQDLNIAVTRGAHIAMAHKADGVLILPADLPFLRPEDVQMMVAGAEPAGSGLHNNGYYFQQRVVTICSDHNSEGTNALLVCPPAGFTFQYGRNSFQNHLDEAERLGMKRRIVHAPSIKFDLDTEKDWEIYQTMQPAFALNV